MGGLPSHGRVGKPWSGCASGGGKAGGDANAWIDAYVAKEGWFLSLGT